MQPAGEVLQVHTAAEDQGIRRGVPKNPAVPVNGYSHTISRSPTVVESIGESNVAAGPRQITVRTGPVVAARDNSGAGPVTSAAAGLPRSSPDVLRRLAHPWAPPHVSRLIRRDDLLLGLGIPTPGTRGRDQAESAQQYCERHTTPDASHEDSSRSATARTIRGQSLDEQGSQSRFYAGQISSALSPTSRSSPQTTDRAIADSFLHVHQVHPPPAGPRRQLRPIGPRQIVAEPVLGGLHHAYCWARHRLLAAVQPVQQERSIGAGLIIEERARRARGSPDGGSTFTTVAPYGRAACYGIRPRAPAGVDNPERAERRSIVLVPADSALTGWQTQRRLRHRGAGVAGNKEPGAPPNGRTPARGPKSVSAASLPPTQNPGVPGGGESGGGVN